MDNYENSMNSIQLGPLIIICSFLLMGCSVGYKVEDDKVYYEYWNEGSGQGMKLMEDADAKTFESLEFDCNCSFDFGRDKDHLFIDGKTIRDIDPKTFEFIGNYTFKDKDSVYFFGFYNDINDCALKGVDPKKLKLLTYPWAKAGNILCHGSDTLTLSDIDDFVPIDEDWGKTKKYVISWNEILQGADPESFRVIDRSSGRDKNHKYEFGRIVE